MRKFKSIHISPELKSFFKVIQQWITDGCPEVNKYDFTDCVGLCNNLTGCKLSDELVNMFEVNNLDIEFPFNNGISTPHYFDEENKYTNPMRLAFIKFYAQD